MSLTDVVERLWLKRRVLTADEFADLGDAAKAKAFSMAVALRQNLASELYQSLLNVIREGKTVEEWAHEAQSILDAYGDGGRLLGFTGSRANAWYADMVFRTNVQQAYAAGRYAEMFDEIGMASSPYWRYSTVGDNRVRPTHAALDGMIFAKSDPTSWPYLPPLGFNCRCMAEEVGSTSRRRLQTGSIVRMRGVTPDKGWDYNRLDLVREFNPLRQRRKRA